jgi:hypothetical protein
MDKQTATQLANIEKRTGKSLEQLADIVRSSGLTRHGEVRDMLKRDHGMGHGDANLVVHYALESDGGSASAGKAITDVVDEIYSGAKAALRPIHDRIMAAIDTFGPFEIAPKKGYLSLRRKKQFAMIGPATKTAVEVGLNARELPSSPRLTVVPPGAMCQYKVRVSEPDDVDAQLVAWVRHAYDTAG